MTSGGLSGPNDRMPRSVSSLDEHQKIPDDSVCSLYHPAGRLLARHGMETGFLVSVELVEHPSSTRPSEETAGRSITVVE